MRNRQVRTVALHENIRYWGFLPGGKKIYAYDKGAWIVDLTTGTATDLYPKSVEVGGFQASPKGDRFLIGNEIGPSREYDLVEITP